MQSDRFEFTPLPLLRLVEDEIRQVCRLTVSDQPAPAETTLAVRREGMEFSFPLQVVAGASEHEIELPQVAAACQARVELRIEQSSEVIEVAFAPVRRWEVFLVNHSHTDIGFTHTPSDVVRVHTKNLERALEFVEATADWPDEVRYRWTCESAWQVQNFLRTNPEDRERLKRAVDAGAVEIEALYIHSYFDLLNREQLVRSLYFAQEVRETLDVPITSAMICDVPGAPWSLVDVLAGSGIRYLSMAPNNFLAPFHEFTDLPRPFVWQGPAGGRVIVWYTDDPYWAYIEGARHGFWAGFEEVERKLPLKLAALEAEGYPFDVVQIQTGSDNRPLRLLPATIARDWNRRYLSPRLRVTTPSAFFRHAETAWADRLPVVSGEWQSSWSQTTLHYPNEANQSRRNHGTLDLWERTAVFADLIDEAFVYPRAELAATYDASLLFDEHSGPKGIWRPRNQEQALAAVREGYEIFQQATGPARRGLETALAAATDALAGGDDQAVVVWNTLSWARGGEVETRLPTTWVGPATVAIDEASGLAVPLAVAEQEGGVANCRLAAEAIPAMGFKRYRIVTGTSAAVSPKPTATSAGGEARLENGDLTLVVDHAGCITSLVDKQTGRELVDRSRWAGLNALVRYLPAPHGPEPGGDFNAATGLYVGTPVDGQTLSEGTIGPEPLTVERSLGTAIARAAVTIAETYRREVEVRLLGDRVEIRNRLDWLRRPDVAEVLYALFPFALPSPEIRHAGQYGIVDPLRQTLSGSCLDGFAIQNWLDLNAGGAGVTVNSTDLALVDYGGIHIQRFLRKLEVDDGLLAFRVANGKSLPPPEGDPFGGGGAIEFRFVLRPYVGGFDPLAATRFGEEEALPLKARPLPARNPGEWKGASGSFVSLRGASGVLTGLKRAERGDGYVVRIWESAGRRSIAHLSFPHHELLAAYRVTPAEGDMGRVDVVDGGIRVELKPFELVGFRCVLGR